MKLFILFYVFISLNFSISKAKEVRITPFFPIDCHRDTGKYVGFLRKTSRGVQNGKLKLDLLAKFGACTHEVIRYKRIRNKKGIFNFIYEYGIPPWEGGFPVDVLEEKVIGKVAYATIEIDLERLGDALITMRLFSGNEGWSYYPFDIQSVIHTDEEVILETQIDNDKDLDTSF